MTIDIASVLTQWGNWGVFTYLLPALLIFAVVFGILTAKNILGNNKGVHVIVALVVAILGVFGLNQFVGNFYLELFPRVGVGLAVIVSLVIITSLFMNDGETKYWFWGISAVGVIIWIVATTQSFQSMGFFSIGGVSGEDMAALVIGAVLIIGIIIAVASSGSSSSEKEKPKTS